PDDTSEAGKPEASACSQSWAGHPLTDLLSIQPRLDGTTFLKFGRGPPCQRTLELNGQIARRSMGRTAFAVSPTQRTESKTLITTLADGVGALLPRETGENVERPRSFALLDAAPSSPSDHAVA